MDGKRERIEKYWRSRGFKNEKSFCEYLGLHQDHVSKLDAKGSSGKLMESLAEKCKDLNLSWVITGEGIMLVGEKETPQDAEHLRRLFEEISKVFPDSASLVEKSDKLSKVMRDLRNGDA